MKKLFLVIGLIPFLSLPSLKIASNANNDSFETTIVASEVETAFEYSGFQTITYAFDTTNGPTITISENITVTDKDPLDSYSFTDFVGLNFKLTGVETNYISNPSNLPGHDVSEIITSTYWLDHPLTLEEIEANPSLSHLTETEKQAAIGKTTYTEQLWNEGGTWNNVSGMDDLTANIAQSKIPKPHETFFDPVNGLNMSFEQLTSITSGDLTSPFRDPFEKGVNESGQEYYQLNVTYTFDKNTSREVATYNYHSYYDWINFNFKGYGECSISDCSFSEGGYGRSQLNYEIELYDAQGNKYPMTFNNNWIGTKIPLNELILSVDSNPVASNQTKVSIDIASVVGVNPSNYNLFIKPVYQVANTDLKEETWQPFLQSGNFLSTGVNYGTINLDTTQKYTLQIVNDANGDGIIDDTEINNSDDFYTGADSTKVFDEQYVPPFPTYLNLVIFTLVVAIVLLIMVSIEWFISWRKNRTPKEKKIKEKK